MHDWFFYCKLCRLIQVPDNWDEMEGSYDPLAQPIASKKLKVVKVHYDERDRWVHNIVRIMKSHLGIEEVNSKESFQMQVSCLSSSLQVFMLIGSWCTKAQDFPFLVKDTKKLNYYDLHRVLLS